MAPVMKVASLSCPMALGTIKAPPGMHWAKSQSLNHSILGMVMTCMERFLSLGVVGQQCIAKDVHRWGITPTQHTLPPSTLQERVQTCCGKQNGFWRLISDLLVNTTSETKEVHLRRWEVKGREGQSRCVQVCAG